MPLNLDAAWTEGDFALPLLENGLPGTLTIAPARHFEGFYIAKIKKAHSEKRPRERAADNWVTADGTHRERPAGPRRHRENGRAER